MLSDAYTIFTQNAPKPVGHYSQAIVHNGFVVEAILSAAGSDLDQVLKMTLYISDMALWDQVNAVNTRMLGEYRPAHVVVPTRDLHYGFRIEIEVLAAVKESM